MITWIVKPPQKKRPHDWGHMARLPYPLCTRCGLLRLRNEASEKAARAKCQGHEEDD